MKLCLGHLTEWVRTRSRPLMPVSSVLETIPLLLVLHLASLRALMESTLVDLSDPPRRHQPRIHSRIVPCQWVAQYDF